MSSRKAMGLNATGSQNPKMSHLRHLGRGQQPKQVQGLFQCSEAPGQLLSEDITFVLGLQYAKQSTFMNTKVLQ